MPADSTPEDEVRRLERHYSVNPEGLVFARLADAYRRCGRLERSLELLREGLERHPDYTTGHLIEGRTLREADRPEEAAESFRRVLQLDAGNLVALRSLAELAAERGDMAEAHRWTDRLEQADPFTSFNPADVAARARESRESPESRERDEKSETTGGGGAAEPTAGSTDAGEVRLRAPEGGEGGEPPPSGPTELPGEDGLASEIAAMADEQWWSSAEEDPSADDDAEDSDVATETMAHLYAEQGLYEEAADVYRRLLDRRPDDEGLRRRLEEMTRRASGGEAATPPTGRSDEPRPEQEEQEAPEASGETAREPVSAREHFRALLRGRARPVGDDRQGRAPGDDVGGVATGDRRGAAGEAAG